MKLFLASEAKHPDSLERLKKYIGGFSGKSIAYIPTAANGEGFGSWKEGGSWNLVQTLGANVTLVQLEDIRNSSVVDMLIGKDIIWVAGGYCAYLMYWMRRCKLDKHMKDILNRGSLYVGSSAGSMITYKNLDLADWYIGEVEPGAKGMSGLGLVDFEIYPHYEDSLHDQIKKLYKGERMYLLKNGEAVLVEGNKVSVLGDERILP